MATECCTQEAILQFLTEQGGRVKNTDLIHHFKHIFPDERERKAVVREKFKNYVDNVAFVKVVNGVKFVCVRKKCRYSLIDVAAAKERECVEGAAGTALSEEEREGSGSGVESRRTTEVVQVNDETGVMGHPPPSSSPPSRSSVEDAVAPGAATRGEAQRRVSPAVSGYGNDSVIQVRESLTVRSGAILSDKTEDIINFPKFECVVHEVGDDGGEFDMGNVMRCKSETNGLRKSCIQSTSDSVPDIPQIAVIEASPLPAAADGSMFTLPGCPTPGHVDSCFRLSPEDSVFRQDEGEPDSLGVPRGSPEANHSNGSEVIMRRTARGSRRRSLSSQPSDDEEADEGQSDSHSLSGSEGSTTPKGSRKHFIEHMMNTSPQVRRSMLRNSSYLSSRHEDGMRRDSDTASLASSIADEDRAAVTLDPLEHQWMLCASDGVWASLHHLLSCEPSLIWKKDFITGFTCLHWAAKQGKPELLALIVNFAKQHDMPVNINGRSSAGYTPLHLAAMHNHVDVVKLLVGAYDADVDIRDYNGKRASQYLADSATVDIRDIVGAHGDSDSENVDTGDGVRWRLSRVLQKPRRSLKGSFKSRPKSNLFG